MPERQKVTQLQLIGTYAEDLQRITTGGRLKDSKKKKKILCYCRNRSYGSHFNYREGPLIPQAAGEQL